MGPLSNRSPLHARPAGLAVAATVHAVGMLLIAVMMVAVIPSISSAQDGASPPPARTGLAPDGHLQLHSADICPVCAMRPAKYAKFAAAITLDDRRTYYFCSNGCMLRAWLHPKAFLNAAPGQRLMPTVQAFFTGRPMDAGQVTWVAGSDVMGPMGPAIVALETPASADTFQKRHGGKFVFTLDEMTDALWEKIKGRKALW